MIIARRRMVQTSRQSPGFPNSNATPMSQLCL